MLCLGKEVINYTHLGIKTVLILKNYPIGYSYDYFGIFEAETQRSWVNPSSVGGYVWSWSEVYQRS